MKIKKTTISTSMGSLYGKKKYHEYIRVGETYIYWFPENSDVGRFTGKTWVKFTVTYIRSNVAFYILPDYPDFEEHSFSVKSIMAEQMMPIVLDPYKEEFDKIWNIDLKRYRFDDSYTDVINFDNSEEVEVDENDITIFDICNGRCGSIF